MNSIGKTTKRAEKLSASVQFAERLAIVSDNFADGLTVADSLGIQSISRNTSALLTSLAKMIGAKTVAEVGTGAGLSALALLRGMSEDGILTSIDIDAEHQTAARSFLESAGIPNRRLRFIPGAALNILPKLNKNSYDLVFIDGDPLEVPEYLAYTHDLLRPNGVAVVNHILWRDLVADLNNEDDEALIMREALAAVTENKHWTPLVLPVGDGVLVLVK